MKNIFGIILLISAMNSYAQPIIINSSDIPIPGGPFNNLEYSPIAPPAPTPGNNLTLDYSSFSGTALVINNIIPETDTFFTMAGVEVQRHRLKDLNYTSGYDVIDKFDFNANGVIESGVEVPYQGYDLSSVTGSNQDSIIFPAQKYLVNNPTTLMQFPFTANSSWHSVSRHSNEFDLTVASFFLNHEPGEHVYWNYRNDSIVGWGKMRVYTTSGPSIWYDVLMDKYEEYSIDSFYLNGSPAPAPLLSAFTVSQGQKTNANYGYDFYRAGSFNFLVRFNFATDSTYSFVLATLQNIDNILSTGNLAEPSYSTLIFPNPVVNEINIKIIGSNFLSNDYQITDVAGRVVQEGLINSKEEAIRIQLANNFGNGVYFIRIKDKSGNIIAKENITVQQ